MKSYLKDLVKVLLTAVILNIVLGIVFTIIFSIPESFDFSILLFVFTLLVFSAGLLLFGGMFVVYNKKKKKKPVLALSVSAAIIAILSLSLYLHGYFSALSSFPLELYFTAVWILAIALFFGLTAFLVKGIKENKQVTISTLVWFLITLVYYCYFSIILSAGIFILS